MGDLRIDRVTTMADQMDASPMPERVTAALSGFGALGAILAILGLFGLLVYTVARRVPELGVRMALGATRGRVMRSVLGSAVRPRSSSSASRSSAREMKAMVDAFLIIYSIIAVSAVVVLLDWWGRRREQQSKNRHR